MNLSNNIKTRALKVTSITLGLIFIISGFSKAIDVAGFTQIIKDYGLNKLVFLTPFIILIEIVIGLFFFFQIKIKKVSLLASTTLIIFSIIYTYANIFNGVTNCGCFGTWGENVNPFWVYFRNGIMLLGSLFVFFQYKSEKRTISYEKKVIIITSILIGSYLTGLTTKNKINFLKHKKETSWIGLQVKQTPLKTYWNDQLNSKKTLVFVFSYTCPHCLNSIENLKQYKISNYVDDIILLGTGTNKDKNTFYKNFNLTFQKFHLPKKEIKKITTQFPTGYFISNGIIERKWKGTLPAYQVLQKMNIN